MDPLYWWMFFGVAFFGFIVIVGVVKARRKKEKAYYISAVLSFLMLLSCIFVIFNQFVFVLALFIAMGILSIAALPKIIQVLTREPLQELQETDLSAPLRIRELRTRPTLTFLFFLYCFI
jgi:predicted MFS family arabinose efflux permease